jgi:hypothetical protein
MTSNDQLGARVRTTLHAKADAIDPTERAFDPGRRIGLDVPELVRIEHGRPGRTRRRVLIGSAAAAVLVVAASIGYVAANGEGKPTTVHTLSSSAVPTTTAQSAALPPLVPAWVPAGFQLWSIETMPVPASSRSAVAPLFQRFQSTGDPSRVIDVQGTPIVHTSPPAHTTDIVVRGRQGFEFDEHHPEGDGTADSHHVIWQEDGLQLFATGQGVDSSTVVAFLDDLTWRGTAPLQGFAAPAGPSWDLTVDEPGGGPVVTSPTLQLTYVDPSRIDGSGNPLGLQVMTNQSNTVVAADPTYTAAANEVRSATADGRSAEVISPNWSMSRADLTRVATSVAPVDAAHLASLRREADANVVAHLPVMASAALDSATAGTVTVEVRGTGGDPNVVCLVVKGQRSCGARYLLTLPTSPIDASVIVDGTWLVAAIAPAHASTGAAQTPEVHDGGPNGGALGALLPGATRASVGGWTMTLVAPSDSVTSYSVGLAGHLVGGDFRPTR